MNQDKSHLIGVVGVLLVATALVVALLPSGLIDRGFAVVGAALIAISGLLFLARMPISSAVFVLGLAPIWISVIANLPEMDWFFGNSSCDGCRELGAFFGTIGIVMYGIGLVLGALASVGLFAAMLSINAKLASFKRNGESSTDA